VVVVVVVVAVVVVIDIVKVPTARYDLSTCPNNYPDTVQCVWTITTDPGTNVRLTFDTFDIESGHVGKTSCPEDSLVCVWTITTYPGNYPDTVQCVWTITTSPGTRVRLTFDTFDIESGHVGKTSCPEDSLVIYAIFNNRFLFWPQRYTAVQPVCWRVSSRGTVSPIVVVVAVAVAAAALVAAAAAVVAVVVVVIVLARNKKRVCSEF
ncbi:cubilin, partial [Elysia marginata]